jgi:hypothetical protein
MRPISRTNPSTCQKIRYSNRKDTRGDHAQQAITAGQRPTGGRSVTVYAQHEVLKDLIARRVADGGDVRFVVTDTSVEGIDGDRPTIRFTHDGEQQSLECDFVIGADGSRSFTRFLIPEGEIRTDFFRQYPFAWFGILAEAPPSSDELIYAHSDRGFAPISTRSPSVQRRTSRSTRLPSSMTGPTTASGPSCGPASQRRAPPSKTARSSARMSCSSGRSCVSRCSTGGMRPLHPRSSRRSSLQVQDPMRPYGDIGHPEVPGVEVGVRRRPPTDPPDPPSRPPERWLSTAARVP